MKHQRLEELFHDALQLDSGQRSAFLDQVAIEDAGLRHELEELLGCAHSRTLTILRAPNIYPSAEAHHIVDDRIDHYELMRKLGHGGMGTVFLARDTKLDRLVALKLFHPQEGTGSRLFLEEARVTARCRHENIVVVHDVGIHRESPYMVLEYLEGANLRRRMPKPGESAEPGPAMPLDRIVELIRPVLRALRCAHEHHIIHCDLKPENIFVTDSGAIKVLDFGIARAMADTVNLRNQAPSPGPGGPAPAGDREPRLVVGTPLYMSPEQWGAAPVDARSDIWAVGILLYEMAAGRHPLMPLRASELAPLVTDMDRPMPRLGEAVAGLGGFAEIVDDCLRKRKEERIQSIDMLLDRLQSLSSSSSSSGADSGALVLEFCDLDSTRCKQFERARITEHEHRRDTEEFEGYGGLLQKKMARDAGSKKLERLQARLERWMRCMPGEPLFRRRGRERDAVLLLLTVRNTSSRQSILHTIEIDLFERDWLSRSLPRPSSRLLEPMADYACDVQKPWESFPMIPNIAIAPDDVVSFHVTLSVRFYRYSLRVRVCGSDGCRVETEAMHVW